MEMAFLPSFLEIKRMMFRKALVIMARQGSRLVGSVSMANKVSVHRVALAVLHIAVNIEDLISSMLLVDGIVHCVPCNILGTTSVAMPLVLRV